MRTDLIAAVSALALLSCTAAVASAQTATGDGAALGPSSTTPASPAVGETSQSLGVVHVEDFLEKNVIAANDQAVGTVEDVLFGPDGQPLRLILSTGPAGKTVAIDLSRVEVRSDSDALFVSSLTRDDIQAMPAFEGDDNMTSLNASRPPAPKDAAPKAGAAGK